MSVTWGEVSYGLAGESVDQQSVEENMIVWLRSNKPEPESNVTGTSVIDDQVETQDGVVLQLEDDVVPQFEDESPVLIEYAPWEYICDTCGLPKSADGGHVRKDCPWLCKWCYLELGSVAEQNAHSDCSRYQTLVCGWCRSYSGAVIIHPESEHCPILARKYGYRKNKHPTVQTDGSPTARPDHADGKRTRISGKRKERVLYVQKPVGGSVIQYNVVPRKYVFGGVDGT